MSDFTENAVSLATGKISYLSCGEGDPIVCLHHSWGSVGAHAFHTQLSESHHVVLPEMPGWGASERPLWARDVRDIAILCGQFINEIFSRKQVHLVGLGFGGYVAAELTCMNEHALKSLTLIGSPGLYPTEGEILDQMMVSHRRYIELSFRDTEMYQAYFGEEPDPGIREIWDQAREMTARIAWKPYFFNRRLEHTLRNVSRSLNSCLIWGAADTIVPLSVGALYKDCLGENCSLNVVRKAGHLVELEEPDVTITHMQNVLG